MNTDLYYSILKVLRNLERAFVRPPGSARILFTTKTRRREEIAKDFLRVFVVRFFWLRLCCLCLSVFICGFILCSREISSGFAVAQSGAGEAPATGDTWRGV